jgi:hypothetical protein
MITFKGIHSWDFDHEMPLLLAVKLFLNLVGQLSLRKTQRISQNLVIKLLFKTTKFPNKDRDTKTKILNQSIHHSSCPQMKQLFSAK